jgi:hypothetical protein
MLGVGLSFVLFGSCCVVNQFIREVEGNCNLRSGAAGTEGAQAI